MNQDLLIVRILGVVAVLSLVAVAVLLFVGRTSEAAITGLIGLGSAAIGSLGGALRGTGNEKKGGEE